MPPRRSSRSRASVEPDSATLKRKRAPEDVDVDSFSEKDNLAKEMAAKSRKAGVSTRSSGSSRNGLQEVAEADSEAENSPPAKKSRPSLELEEEDDDDDEIQEVPKAVATRNATRSSRKPVSLKTEPSDERRTTRGASANPPSSRATRGSRSSKPLPTVIRLENSNDEEKPSVASSSRTDQDIRIEDIDQAQEDQEMSDEEEDVKPTKRARSKSPSSQATTPRASTSMDAAEEDVKPAKRRKGSKPPSYHTPSPADDDDVKPDTNPQLPLPAVSEDVEDESSQAEPDVAHKADDEGDAQVENLSARIPVTQSQATFEKPGRPLQRLVISNIVLVNFKSYAGRQEIGPFHKSFSSIVGPNGSGKSNTIDALLFVFGFPANKMRQGKLSELIHHSAKYPDLQQCSVEVHFREIIDLEGPDDFQVVPGSQLVVTRTAFKDNSSKYTVDKKPVARKEVRELLLSRGIDLDHNRFLILQGEVESIALMKPKGGETEEGLLEYLEDIIGTASLKEPIEEALAKFEELQEARAEKLNRLRLVEKEREALEEKKKEVDAWYKMCNEYTKAQSRMWQFEIYELLQKEEGIRNKLVAAQEALHDEEERNKENVAHMEEVEAKFRNTETTYEEVRDLAAKINQQHNEQAKKKAKGDEKRKHAKSKVKKLQKIVTDDEATRAEAQRTLDENTSKATKKRKGLEQAEADLVKEETALEAITESLKDKTQVFHEQITVKQRELAPWKDRIDSKRAEIEVATSERDGLAKKAEMVAEACKQAEENFQELKSDQDAKVAEHKKLGERKANLASELKAAEAHVATTQHNLAQCRTKASSTRQTVAQARASQAEGKSQNAVLQALTKLASEGKIQGFHGRLGSLGKIADDKYDVAVTTACGMLNHLVTDKVEQGQACLEHLRRTNIGRASIMVLDKVQATAQQMAKKPQPEDVPRLFDLITPKDPKFACAFYKAVGETLVAEDMDQATRIAYGGPQPRRVVTLQGQMIEANGTMGGGGKAASGGMSSKFTADAVAPNVLRNYELENEKAERALQVAQQENVDAETRRDQLVASGPQISLEVDKLNMEIENGKRRMADAERRVRQLQSQNKPDAGDLARIRKLNADIKQWESELETLLENSREIEAAIKDLEKRILDIGGSRLLAQRAKVEGVQFRINLLGEEITKAEVAYEKAENDIKRLTGSLKTNKADLVKAEKELQAVETELEEVEAYLEEFRKAVDKAKGEEETWREHVQALAEEYGAMQEQIQEFKKERAKRQNAVNAAQKAVGEVRVEIGQLQDLHDGLRLEDVDEDDDDDANEGDAAMDTENKESSPEDVEMEDVKPERDAAKSKLPEYTLEQLKKMKRRDLTADVQIWQDRLEKKGQPNVAVKEEWKKKEKEFTDRADDVDLVTAQRDAQKAAYEGLRKRRLDEFMTGFSMISLKLKEMYQMITLGGNAELELVDSMDPFSEGIIFSVMPPKKSWKSIANLSGGEKTLSSLALVFALHVYKPTPLYFMDEIDAALDFRNVSIVANYIKDRTRNAQFIIISLRNNMFELSNRLIGIYKTSNATHSVSIDNEAGQGGVLEWGLVDE